MNKTDLNARWIFFTNYTQLYSKKKKRHRHNILDFVRFGFFLIGLAIKTKKKRKKWNRKTTVFSVNPKVKKEKWKEQNQQQQQKTTTSTTSKITTKKYP